MDLPHVRAQVEQASMHAPPTNAMTEICTFIQQCHHWVSGLHLIDQITRALVALVACFMMYITTDNNCHGIKANATSRGGGTHVAICLPTHASHMYAPRNIGGSESTLCACEPADVSCMRFLCILCILLSFVPH